jgi:hypothetical protein
MIAPCGVAFILFCLATRRAVAKSTVCDVPQRVAKLNEVEVNKTHYFQVPKTGSSVLVGALQRYCKDSVVLHEHGCSLCQPLEWCDARTYLSRDERMRGFGVLRHPCEHIESVAAHMDKAEPAGPWTASSTMTTTTTTTTTNSTTSSMRSVGRLLHWLRGGCLANYTCMVDQIRERYPRQHKVVLYPQALYLPTKEGSGKIVCYGADGFWDALSATVAAQTEGRCDLGPEVRTPSGRGRGEHHGITAAECAATRAIYHEDARLWSKHCATAMNPPAS